MLFYCHFIEGTRGKVPGSIANTSDCTCPKTCRLPTGNRRQFKGNDKHKMEQLYVKAINVRLPKMICELAFHCRQAQAEWRCPDLGAMADAGSLGMAYFVALC